MWTWTTWEIVTQDFRLALQAYRDGTERAVLLARQRLGSVDRAFVFHRYLETVLPQTPQEVTTPSVRAGLG